MTALALTIPPTRAWHTTFQQVKQQWGDAPHFVLLPERTIPVRVHSIRQWNDIVGAERLSTSFAHDSI